MPRERRKRSPGLAHYGAPALFLLGVTVAVLLVRAGLQQGPAPAPTGARAVTTAPPRTAGAATTTVARRFYTVQTGDTFGTIAAKVGISVERLQSLNPGVSSNALQVGQKLRVK